MAKRTRAHRCHAALVLSGSLALGCDGPSNVPPPPPPAPAVLSVTNLSPNNGSIYGPTTIAILGTGFDTEVIVIFDGVAVNTTRPNSTTISFVAPAHAAGSVPVVVANGDGKTVSAPGYTYRAAPLHVFTDVATGFSTAEVRDAQDQIVHFDADGYLIWAENGTALTGFPVVDGLIPALPACSCWLVIRFGTVDGERRAYLTADYGHDNPGTVIDLEVAGGALTVTQRRGYPPGTYPLAGVVTEVTGNGVVAVGGAEVYLLVGDGYRYATTDVSGAYEIRGLYPSNPLVYA